MHAFGGSACPARHPRYRSPQRYCHATPTAVNSLPVRVAMPVLAESFSEFWRSIGKAGEAGPRDHIEYHGEYDIDEYQQSANEPCRATAVGNEGRGHGSDQTSPGTAPTTFDQE